MPIYLVHGLTIRLPAAIAGFVEVECPGAPDVDVQWAQTDRRAPSGADDWTEIPLVQDERAFPVYRAWRHPDQGYRWHAVGPTRALEYWISPCLRRIEVKPDPEVATIKLMRPTFGQALAFLLRAQRRLLLHAASVEIAGGAVLVVGESGAGKSTLVYELVRQGCGFLSDDMALPDLSGTAPMVSAGHGSVKLMPDSAAALAVQDPSGWPVAAGGIKREAGIAPRRPLRPVPITTMLLLGPRGNVDAPRVEPVDAAQAMLALTGEVHPRYLPIGTLDAAEPQRVFEQLAQLLGRVRTLRLRRPDRLGDVPAAAQTVIAALAR